MLSSPAGFAGPASVATNFNLWCGVRQHYSSADSTIAVTAEEHSSMLIWTLIIFHLPWYGFPRLHGLSSTTTPSSSNSSLPGPTSCRHDQSSYVFINAASFWASTHLPSSTYNYTERIQAILNFPYWPHVFTSEDLHALLLLICPTTTIQQLAIFRYCHPDFLTPFTSSLLVNFTVDFTALLHLGYMNTTGGWGRPQLAWNKTKKELRKT